MSKGSANKGSPFPLDTAIGPKNMCDSKLNKEDFHCFRTVDWEEKLIVDCLGGLWRVKNVYLELPVNAIAVSQSKLKK